MTTSIVSYQIPTRLAEALRILDQEGKSAAIISGGTVQALNLPGRVRTLVDLLRCGLEGIEADAKGIKIGATTPAAALAGAEVLDGFGTGMLREAAAVVGPLPVRNQVTLGGNLAGFMSWADLPVTMLAMDARIHTARHAAKKRVVPITELFSKHPRKVLAPGELITSAEIPRPAKTTGGAFIKVSRTEADLALVNAAAWLDVHQGTCREARIALGAVQPRPFRATAAEALLVGQVVSEELLARAAAVALRGIQIHADARASQEYRRQILEVTVKRALCRAWLRSTGDERYEAPRRYVPPPWTRQPPGERVGHILSVNIDGSDRRLHIRPHERLLEVLRRAGATAAKRGCDQGDCGTCAVLVHGRLLNACLLLAAQVEGCRITTGAGVGSLFSPHPLQRALVEEGAVQCGFCTPGMVVAGKALLEQIPDPTEEEIKEAMDGQLCRCTGYVKPIAALQAAARAIRATEGA